VTRNAAAAAAVPLAAVGAAATALFVKSICFSNDLGKKKEQEKLRTDARNHR